MDSKAEITESLKYMTYEQKVLFHTMAHILINIWLNETSEGQRFRLN